MLVFSNNEQLFEGFINTLKSTGAAIKAAAPMGLMAIGSLASLSGGLLNNLEANSGNQLNPFVKSIANYGQQYGGLASMIGAAAFLPQRFQGVKKIAQQTYQRDKMQRQIPQPMQQQPMQQQPMQQQR